MRARLLHLVELFGWPLVFNTNEILECYYLFPSQNLHYKFNGSVRSIGEQGICVEYGNTWKVVDIISSNTIKIKNTDTGTERDVQRIPSMDTHRQLVIQKGKAYFPSGYGGTVTYPISLTTIGTPVVTHYTNEESWDGTTLRVENNRETDFTVYANNNERVHVFWISIGY